LNEYYTTPKVLVHAAFVAITRRKCSLITYVFRDNAKNNELSVNPLGLTIVRLRADQAFS
jgi:type IV secretory pathway component VirB8